MKPWWDQLTVNDGHEPIRSTNSVLTSASRMAEKLFDLSGNSFANGNFVRDVDAGDGGGIGLVLVHSSTN